MQNIFLFQWSGGQCDSMITKDVRCCVFSVPPRWRCGRKQREVMSRGSEGDGPSLRLLICTVNPLKAPFKRMTFAAIKESSVSNIFFVFRRWRCVRKRCEVKQHAFVEDVSSRVLICIAECQILSSLPSFPKIA